MMIDAPVRDCPRAVLVPLGDAALAAAPRILAALRASGIAVDMAFRGNMKKRMSRAADSGAAYALILGDAELARGEVQVKTLATGEQRSVALDRLSESLRA